MPRSEHYQQDHSTQRPQKHRGGQLLTLSMVRAQELGQKRALGPPDMGQNGKSTDLGVGVHVWPCHLLAVQPQTKHFTYELQFPHLYSEMVQIKKRSGST